MTQTVPQFDHNFVAAFLNLSPDVQVSPGPPSYEGTADTIGKAVVITVGSGPGLSDESIFDGVMVAIDVAGNQNDPQSAQDLALLVDAKMLTLQSSATVSGLRIKSVVRAGGRPVPFVVDDGDRWHYSCSYVWSVESGL